MSANNGSTSSSEDEFNPSNGQDQQLRLARKSTCALPPQIRGGPTRRQAAKKASEAILAINSRASASGSSTGTSSFDESMEKFDPDISQREKRKLGKKFETLSLTAPAAATGSGKPPLPRPPLYDDKGKHIPSGKDLCDCLSAKCPGCFFECPKCGSQKCGTVCRVRRQYIVDQIEYHDGQEKIVRNPLKLKRK